MKCPYCNAEITNGKSCEYCGAQITPEMLKEQEQINKKGCPKCGSTNITFNREKQGEVKDKKITAIINSTIGVCKDCGYTWKTSEAEHKPKRKTWLWVLGWICIFPVPLTILMLRKKDMKPALKYGIIAVAWIVYIAIGVYGQDGNKENIQSNQIEPTVKNESANTESGQSEVVETHLYDNAEIRNVMNGPRTDKLGEYVVIFAASSECTEEALADLYYNYFAKNDFNWITIIYTDKNDNSGVYVNTEMIGLNDNFEKDEYNDYSVIESPNEIIYVPNEDGKTLTKMEFS